MAKNDPRSDAMGERPWYEPEDLDNKALEVERAMLENLTEKQKERLTHQSPDRMSARFMGDVHKAAMMGMMGSEAFRLELARNALRKPLEATKQMGAFIDKTVHVGGEVKHLHAIVVPATLSNDAWNQGQSAIGEAQAEGWGAESPWGAIQTVIDVEEE